jgi:methionine-rich copper-binding protein CopC
VLFAGPTRLSAGYAHSIDNRMFFLTMALPLDETITVFATSGITDMSGNPLQPLTSTFRTAAEFDTTRPQVVTQRPTGSTVAVTAPITLFLNDALNPATVQGALYVSQNGLLIDGTTSVGWSNRAITFTPAAPFAPQATVEIRLTEDARDLAGNAAVAYYGTFVTAADTASTTPTLVHTNPAMYSNDNPTNVVLELEFNEPLNPASLSAANVFVRDALNQPVAGALSMRNGNRVVRFTPAANFAPSNYNYFYYSGLTDLQGVSITSSNFYFYTGATADSSTPTVSFVNPPAGTTGVGVNSPVRVTFSKPVNPTTLNANTLVLAAGATLATTLSVASDNRTVTITPQLPLPASTQITLTITGVEDQVGHTVATSATTFTTGNAPDIIGPTLVATSTNYGDTSVAVNSIFEWTYSEAIDVSTILGQTNVLYDYTVGYVTGGTLSVSPDARTVTYVPPSALVAGRTYSVNASGVTDLAGNVSGAVSIYFSTASASDLTPPHVVATNPAAGATGVPLNARIRIAFDEPISATTLTNVNVIVSGLPLPIASRTLSGGDRVVTLTLTSLLAPNTVHTISANVRDRAGNAMPAPETATFTTGNGVDLLNLATTVTPSPTAGTTGVSINATPTVTFSDAIDPTSVIYGGTSGVVLVVAATGQIVPVTYSFSADRRTVTMTPVSPLSAGTQYRIQASSGTTDVAGNIFPTTVQSLFTTQP